MVSEQCKNPFQLYCIQRRLRNMLFEKPVYRLEVLFHIEAGKTTEVICVMHTPQSDAQTRKCYLNFKISLRL